MVVANASKIAPTIPQLAGLGDLLPTGTTPVAAPAPAAEQSSRQLVLAQLDTVAEVYDVRSKSCPTPLCARKG